MDQASVRPPSLSEQLARNPEPLLEVVLNKPHLKCGAALARTLGVTSPPISHIRRGKQPVSQSILVRMLKAMKLHIRELHQLVQFRVLSHSEGLDPCCFAS